MPDWTGSMKQTFEYCTVIPELWCDDKQIKTVKSCTIKRDDENETKGSAVFDITEDIGEQYIRVYMKTVQGGTEERIPLGTFLVQTPSSSFDGKTKSISVDAYTPLIELKGDKPPIGYSIAKKQTIMDMVYMNTREHCRAPVSKPTDSTKLENDFVANIDETWMSYLTDLMANAEYSFGLDELSRILFVPDQDTATLQPIWTYDDGNSSILYPSITMDRDLYGIPNTVEVYYSSSYGDFYYKVVNDDPNSPTSTINRGRTILTRETSPKITGIPTKDKVKDYATKLLRELSTVECKITYTHGFNTVNIGDCVRLDYKKAGLNGVKAKVVSQSIKCEPGCPVTETATYSNKLWG